MTFVHGGSHRSTRLLPLESGDVLTSTDRFCLHVLDDDKDGKLHEHVAFYWDQQLSYQAYQQRLLRVVGSTRGPTRFVGFPQVPSTIAAAVEGRERTAASESSPQPPSPSASSTGTDCFLEPRASLPLVASVEATTDQGSDDGEAKWQPPRALAAWNWVRLVAPYERLLCPSLQFSALLSPTVGRTTPLVYGTVPPSPSPSTPPSSLRSFRSGSPLPGIPARWSSQTCRTLWALHEAAAAVSLPAQDVYILCAGTLLYLDVVVSSGRVWAEMEELWGAELVNATQDDATTGSATQLDAATALSADAATSVNASTAALAALKATLSQPPQTYASLLQHVRVLLEALVYVRPSTTARPTSAGPAERGGGDAVGRRLAPHPLLPWLTAAMESEEWTATTAVHASAPAANTPAGETARHTFDLAWVVKVAVREWLARRGTTVTAAAPTGSRAVALPMRDMEAPSMTAAGSTQNSAGGRARPGSSTSANGVQGARAQGSGSTSQRAASAVSRADASAPDRGPSAPSAGGAPLAFEAFEPHDTPRAQHLFALPPLPQDPALLVFAVVWRRTLRRCVLEREVARQQLRQLILGQSGQRCEELLREVRQQQERLHKAAGETATSSSSFPSVAAEEAGHVGGAASTMNDTPTPVPPTPPPLLLLTGDSAATSFRVLGPRSGEWVTSRTGTWAGFCGDLFRCVGHAPPPPSPQLLRQSCRSPSSTRLGRARASVSMSGMRESGAPLVEPPLLERFVDGAVELGNRIDTVSGRRSSGGGNGDSKRTPSSSSAAAASISFNGGAPVTTEELADRLCRLGVALPRYATEITGDRLRPADADYVGEVLQQQSLPLFLACKRRGIQQWSLRGWLQGVALTLLDNSGMESRVTTPTKLVQMGRQQLAAAMGSVEGVDTAAALRMVMEGGIAEVAAFLEHVLKRRERLLRWLPARKVAPALPTDTATKTIPVTSVVSLAVEALLLRRAEESALFSIFQCHPLAVALTGCGVQRLALHANAQHGKSNLLLVRSCGVVCEWDVQDCYEPPRLRRLRAPKRLTRLVARSAGADDADAPPREIGAAVERLTLRHIRGMLQYYRRALLTSTCDATTAAASMLPSTPIEASMTEAPGTKRQRGKDGVETVASSPPEKTAAAAKSEKDPTPEQKVVQQRPPMQTHEVPPSHNTPAPSSASPPRPPLQPSQQQQQQLPQSTGLYPIDRAVALYVLRHHPQYFTAVLGCGIRDVVVANAGSAHEPSTSGASATAAAVAEGETTRVVSNPPPPSIVNAPASAMPALAHSNTAVAGKAVLVVERVCGVRVEVDVEACYDLQLEGHPLRPLITLV